MSRTLRLLPAAACAVLLMAGALRADAPTGDATVPDCVGLDVAAAQSLAKNAGFETSLAFGAPGAAGSVVSQEPGGLTVRPVGGTIALTVAGSGRGPSDPPPATPPGPPSGSLPPMPEGPPAGASPSPVELPPPTVRPPPGETPPGELPPSLPPTAVPPTLPPQAGIDIDALPVDPLPNTEGPQVPTVLNLAREQAQAKLSQWKVEVEMIFASPEANGRVVEQYPKPTSTLAAGETVTIVLGASQSPGPEHRQVPLLVGLTADEAVTVLKKVGFEPVLRSAVSTSADRGRVLMQTPKRFSFAQRGLGVRVTVGRGGLGGPVPVVPTPGPPTPSPSDPPAGPAPEPVPNPPVGPPTEVPTVPPTPPEPVVPPTPPGPPPGPPKPAPGPVTLLGPADSENYPRAYGANFEWRTVPNADGYEWELQQEAGGGWRQARTEKLIGTKFRPARMEVGRYRWRVRALNGETPGAWSDFRLLYLY